MNNFLVSLVLCLLYFHSSTLLLIAQDPSCACADPQERLMQDLLTVDYWNQRINERMPVTYNHLLQGGYFAMPSARMGDEGEIGIGYSYVPPYRNFNMRFQLLKRLEISGNYRIFHGIDDPILSPLGFGDFSDKGANAKIALVLPEDSDYQLPGIAFGFEDFLGTRSFNARYIVFTQVFRDYHLEVTLGAGAKRIRGIFGGISWMPFRNLCEPYLKGLSLVAEYDATPYRKEKYEKHPDGRVKKSPINFGLKYRLWDYFDFSASYIRGDEFAFSGSAFYNFGTTRGFLPKIDDPLPYVCPVNVEPTGVRRPELVVVQDLIFAFRAQGLDLVDVYLSYNCCQQKVLRLVILNETFRDEAELRCRLNHLLAGLIPLDIAEVIATIETEGFAIQEYFYQMPYLRAFAAKEIGPYELKVLTPLREVTWPDPCTSSHLFSRPLNRFNFELSPKTHTFFGSSTGKFKYTLGVHAGINGFLWNDVYYSVLIGCNFVNDLGGSKDYDRLNPSQLINVRSDIVRYYRQRGITLDEAYLQKNWSLGCGFYARLSGGYFEEEYGGAASEILYYPLDYPWAIGVEGAVLKKRNYTGLGFTDKVRKLEGFTPTYRKFLGSQYFLNVYYDWQCAHVDFKVAMGKFLANDYGARFEVSRYFPSGMRLTMWYTHTNGHDKINGRTYHDKGVAVSMPFDIFYTYSERTLWNYGMSAWLRDVGVQAVNGIGLYDLISDQRP